MTPRLFTGDAGFDTGDGGAAGFGVGIGGLGIGVGVVGAGKGVGPFGTVIVPTGTDGAAIGAEGGAGVTGGVNDDPTGEVAGRAAGPDGAGLGVAVPVLAAVPPLLILAIMSASS
ncbi:MAG: hypothetical protein LBC95_01335 [Candidatus Nomurabacteria bacterium]|nr:hypothetical protein [Candidatus Nomurabacteria bacterium]